MTGSGWGRTVGAVGLAEEEHDLPVALVWPAVQRNQALAGGSRRPALGIPKALRQDYLLVVGFSPSEHMATATPRD